ncbi:MAG: hypothetical protein OXL37_19040 [Chloroflexota bacterium]|nr:hypothetical protein [Chloroflexota bacterium]MDE2961347.1 hypothetical protein [Chloroflexota bacterium]
MNTPVQALNPLFAEAPGNGVEVTTTMVYLSAEDADQIIQTMNFERQRDAEKGHIGMLSDMMTNGEWAAGSQITFAFKDDGTPSLADGQHRLLAASQSGWCGDWNVRILWKGLTSSIQGIYPLLDAHAKKRPAAVIGRALGLTGLSNTMQGKIISAAELQNKWREGRGYTLPIHCKIPPVRDNIDRANERLQSFRAVDTLLQNGSVSSPVRGKLYAANILAIIVETFAECGSEEAGAFWRDVATQGSGTAEWLRNTLLTKKPNRAKGSPGLFFPRAAATAWNSWQASKQPKMVYDKPLAVEQTTLVIPS